MIASDFRRGAGIVGAVAALMLQGVPGRAEEAARPDLAECRQVSDKDAAIAACSAIIARTRDLRTLERAYNRRGLANESTGRFGAAASDFSAVIRLNPKIAGYFNNRMRAYKALGQLDLAMQDAEAAVRLAPTYPFVYHGRGAVRFDMGLYALAVQDYSAALAINAADAPLLVDRGRALVKLGLSDRALADFTSAHAVDPAFMPALRERGMIEVALGRSEEAKADLSAALASGLKDDEALAAYSRLSGGAIAATQPLRTAQAQSPENAEMSGGAALPLTPTERAEQEAARKLQAAKDAEQARQEAVVRLKAERLASANRAAKAALADAAAFVQANHDDPDLVEHLQRLTDLSAALSGSEPAPIERKTAALTAGLSADPLYAAYAGQHASERQREAERDLAIALRTLRVQKAFLIGSVVHDPTAPAAAGFLGFAKQVDGALASPDLDSAQTLVGTIDAAIAKAGLRTSYAAAQAAAAAADEGGGAPAAPVGQRSAAPAGSKP